MRNISEVPPPHGGKGARYCYQIPEAKQDTEIRGWTEAHLLNGRVIYGMLQYVGI